MKVDIENQQSSVSDMLEQIKKIMSQEQIITEEKEDEKDMQDEKEDILELSEDSLVEKNNLDDEKSIIEQEALQKSEPNDLLNKIDSLVTNSDFNHENKGEVKNTQDCNFNEKIEFFEGHENNNLLQQDNKQLEDIINENKKDISEHNNFNQINSHDEKQKHGLVADSVVKESTKAIKELMGAIDKPVNDSLKFKNGSTVEDLIVEIMKPQISEWLNTNLSSIVKKVVEKEVRKLIPKEED